MHQVQLPLSNEFKERRDHPRDLTPATALIFRIAATAYYLYSPEEGWFCSQADAHCTTALYAQRAALTAVISRGWLSCRVQHSVGPRSSLVQQLLPYPTLPYPTLPYPTLPYPTLPGVCLLCASTTQRFDLRICHGMAFFEFSMFCRVSPSNVDAADSEKA